MNQSLGIYNLIDKEGIKKSMLHVLNSSIAFHTYTTPKGLKELRIEISRFIHKNWNYEVNYKNMLITSGSQQSIHLIAQAMLKEGDTVLVEQPTYFGALDIFKQRNSNLVGIPLYENGLDLKVLEENILKYSPKLIYVTPTFHNPTGYAWSDKNRKEFLKIINQYQIMVIEDDPYSLINFTNHKYNSLYQLNDGKNIVYFGTFSKLISPAVNVGYLLANEEIVGKIYPVKKNFDLCTNAFLQYVVLDYLQNQDLEKIISDKIKIYKTLMRKSKKELSKKYKNEIESFSKSKGGIFYLVKFKHPVDTNLFEDGSHYYIEDNYSDITRINICSESL